LRDNAWLVETAGLPPEHAAAAAELAWLAFEDFYAHVAASRERLLVAIARQFQAYSELNQLVAAFEGSRVIGIGAYYDLRETAARQIEGMRLLLEAAEDPVASSRALRTFARNFPPAGDVGGYIARFSVAPDRRGTGIAQGMLDRVESALRGIGLGEARLHVRQENARAIAFYRNQGYEPTGPRALGYLLLRKPLM